MTWDYDAIAALLDRAIGPIDPADPKGRKRLRILVAATELFAKQGYRKTNIDDIARAAGIAKGTVYLYFKNKGAIAYSAIALEKRKHLEQVRGAFDPSVPARERLRRLIETSLLMVAEMPVVSALVRDPRELAAAIHDMPEGVMEQTNTLGLEICGPLLQQAAEEPLPPEEIRDRVQLLQIIRSLSRTVTDPDVRGHLSPRRYAGLLAHVFVTGMLRPQKGEST